MNRNEIESLFNNLDYQTILKINSYEQTTMSAFMELLHFSELITINHIYYLDKMAKNLKLEHLTQHIYFDDENEKVYVGDRGIDLNKVDTSHIEKLLPEIKIDDVLAVAYNIRETLYHLQLICDIHWTNWLEEEMDINKLEEFLIELKQDVSELNIALLNKYLDDLSAFHYKDGKTFRYEINGETTVLDYLFTRRNNQDLSEVKRIVEKFKEDELNVEDHYKQYIKESSYVDLKKMDLFRDMSQHTNEGFSSMLNKYDKLSREVVIKYYSTIDFEDYC